MAVIRSATSVIAALWGINSIASVFSLGHDPLTTDAATIDWRRNTPIYGAYTNATAYNDVLSVDHANANAPILLAPTVNDAVSTTIAAAAVSVRIQPLSVLPSSRLAVWPVRRKAERTKEDR